MCARARLQAGEQLRAHETHSDPTASLEPFREIASLEYAPEFLTTPEFPSNTSQSDVTDFVPLADLVCTRHLYVICSIVITAASPASSHDFFSYPLFSWCGFCSLTL